MDIERGADMKAIGYRYGKEYEFDCGAVAKGIRTGATILVLLLLGIVVFLGISGYNIYIIRDAAPASNYPGFPPSRPSAIPFNNHGGFGGNDLLSLTPLLDHERNASVTAQEDAILQTYFAEYDEDDDGLWSYNDFANFYEAELHCNETFGLMDIKTNDGYLDYDELVTLFTAFYDVPLLHNPLLDDLALNVTEVSQEDVQIVGPQLYALVIYEAVPHGENGIAQEEWYNFVLNHEWQRFNGDNNEVVDFAEFEMNFFESETFLLFQECLREEECENPEAAFQAFQDAEIVHHDRRRMLNKWLKAGISVGVTAVAAVATSVAAVAALPLETAAGVAAVSIMAVQSIGYMIFSGTAMGLINGCYDDRSLVTVWKAGGVSEIAIRDVAVGDYVYDGTDFTKVYYFQKYLKNQFANMLDIRYGVPADQNSITLTPTHLLYREGGALPVRSDEIKIGDVLWGITDYSDGDRFNFTVYDISAVRRVPINPITMSGDMKVNGIKTSVFTHSVEMRDAMHSAGAGFRWISEHIDETLTQNVIKRLISEFKQLITENTETLAASNGVVMTAIYGTIALLLAMAVSKAVCVRRPTRSTKKQI